jgi:hypothetical protein
LLKAFVVGSKTPIVVVKYAGTNTTRPSFSSTPELYSSAFVLFTFIVEYAMYSYASLATPIAVVATAIGTVGPMAGRTGILSRSERYRDA